jgi:AcrR family transcriptional regulator
MARWEPDTRRRLQEAALELYAERGYQQTTAAQIAQRAGLTERTFFRHFPDKREVLFGNEPSVQEALVEGATSVPAQAGARAAIAAALAAAAQRMQPRREGLRTFAALVAAHPELQERDLAKQASLARALAAALADRGADLGAARVSGEVAIAVLRVAFEGWIADGEQRPFTALVDEALRELDALAA